MPVVAIIGAIAAIGIAAETGFAVFATIAAVGATIGAVGAVTGNKALMIAGGVVGAIGGVGALAQSAGIIGSDVGLFGGSFGDGFGSGGSVFGGESFGPPGNLSPQAAIESWNGVGPEPFGPPNPSTAPALSGAPTPTDPSQIINQSSGALQPVEASTGPTLAAAQSPNVTPAAAVDNAPIPQGDITGGTLGTTNNPAAADPNAVVDPSATGSQTPAAPAAPGAAPTSPNTNVPTTPAATAGPSGTAAPGVAGPIAKPPADPSFWDSLVGILDKKGASTVLSGVLQAGASFIAGATNGLTPAQIAALNAQADANTAAANLSRIQQSNMQQPLPVASRAAPVTGAPMGLINTPPRLNVTGVPA